MSAPLRVVRLGRVEYEDGLRLQALYGQARKDELVPDVLLLLEHSPVLTLGRGGKPQNILASKDALAGRGVQVFETNRGGDVTYHGPGQLVGYPIFKLGEGRRDVRRYVRDLEEAMIRTAADYGLTAGRIPKWTGVWLGEEDSPQARKLAAIGVHISRWQTSHGFALNVNTELSHFGLIVPCGIQERGVTSLARELGQRVPLAQVEQQVAGHLAELFGATLEWTAPQTKTVSVALTRSAHRRRELLLLRRRPERGGFWQLVTGRIEEGEPAAAAAAREAMEETGLQTTPRPLDYVHSFAFGDEVPPKLVEETAFAAEVPVGAPVRISGEHDAFEWLALPEALLRLPFEGLRVAARRAAS